MRMSRRLNITETRGKRQIICRKCTHSFCIAAESWKTQAVLHEQVMSHLGALYSTGEEVVMRSFTCPSCGVLLDTEIAMKGDPYLEDRIEAE